MVATKEQVVGAMAKAVKEILWGFGIPSVLFFFVFKTGSVKLMAAEIVYLITIYGIYDYKVFVDEYKEIGLVYLGIFFHTVLLSAYMVAY